MEREKIGKKEEKREEGKKRVMGKGYSLFFTWLINAYSTASGLWVLQNLSNTTARFSL